jgi:hypothetical protein
MLHSDMPSEIVKSRETFVTMRTNVGLYIAVNCRCMTIEVRHSNEYLRATLSSTSETGIMPMMYVCMPAVKSLIICCHRPVRDSYLRASRVLNVLSHFLSPKV